MVAKRFMSYISCQSASGPAISQLHYTDTVILSVHRELVPVVDDNQITIVVMSELRAMFEFAAHTEDLADVIDGHC